MKRKCSQANKPQPPRTYCANSVAAAIAVVFLVLATPILACAGDATLVADSNCGEYVDVVPMDDVANPYSGKYEAWDLWVFENAMNPDASPAIATTEDEAASGVETASDTLKMFVTAEGFAVPQRIYFSEFYSPEGSLPATHCPYFISAAGDMPTELRSEFVGLVAGMRAASMPKIPLWLVDEKPHWALILPSGEVVTLSALGSGAGLPPRLPGAMLGAKGEAFFSFTADGSLLAQTCAGEEWWKLYFVDFEERLLGYNSSTITYQELNGFIVFQDPANISVFDVYDFRGNKVTDPNQVFHPSNNLSWIDAGNIPLVYKAQTESESR